MMNRKQTIRDLVNALANAEENGVLNELASELGNDAIGEFHATVDKFAVKTLKPTWVEVTKENYEEMMNILPPALTTSLGFLVGEPMYHTVSGYPAFQAYAEIGDKYYASVESLTAKAFKAVKPADVLDGV